MEMTRMDKNNVYDRLCKTLTEYEEQFEPIDGVDWSWEQELYMMLVEIQNNWEEITGEDN
jgi:hypothetical protein